MARVPNNSNKFDPSAIGDLFNNRFKANIPEIHNIPSIPSVPGLPSGIEFTNLPGSSSKIINVNFEDNVLSNTDNYTYKFSFFIADPESFNSNDPRLANKKIIFAESGNSGRYYIKTVNIKSMTAPSFKLKNSQHNQFDIELVEPRGFSFMDAVLAASNELNIPNYMFAPYYLQLDFIKTNEAGIPEIVPDVSKLWAIKIIDIESSTLSSGTVYNLNAIEFEHLANSNHAAITSTNFLIDCTTVGSFFINLQKEMNKEKEDQRGIWRQNPDSFKFVIDPEIGALPVRSAEDRKFGPQNQEDTNFWQDRTKFNIPKGMSVESIISNLMISNKEWVTKYLAKLESDSKSSEPIDTSHFHKLWSIDVNIELGEFDFYVGDYARTYIYNIRPYTSIFKTPDPVLLSETINDSAAQDERLKEITSVFNIKKRYDYMFTGRNTEVIEFNFDMNFLWTSHVPIYRGLTVDNARTDGPEIRPDVVNQTETQHSLAADVYHYRATLAAATDERVELEAARNINSTFDKIDQIRKDAGLTDRVEAERLSEQLEASKSRSKATAPQHVSDLPFQKLSKPVTTLPLPATIVIDGNYAGNETSWLADGTIDNYRSVASSIINNIQTADLFKITMVVKGDPYWMGITRIEDRLNLAAQHLDTYHADNIFAVRFRIPTTEDDGGFQLSEYSPIVTGIYATISITHSFSDGQFTQEIMAYRDVNTNILLSKDFMGDN